MANTPPRHQPAGRACLFAAAAGLLACGPLWAVDPTSLPPDPKGVFSFVLENDIVALADAGYTNGVRLSWASPEMELASEGDEPAVGGRRLCFALGQSMFAPRDFRRSDLIPDDRPYGGWLYGSVGFITDRRDRLDHVLLTLGVVGPLSQAENLQRLVHQAVGSPINEGWDHQLDNEPGIGLTYERKWRVLHFFPAHAPGADVIPHASVNVGNVFTDASIGGICRLGYHLPQDYGPPRIRPSLPGSDFFIPSDRLGGYLFGGLEIRAVGRNLFLDGNTFSDSHRVDKEPLVGSVQLGAAITCGV